MQLITTSPYKPLFPKSPAGGKRYSSHPSKLHNRAHLKAEHIVHDLPSLSKQLILLKTAGPAPNAVNESWTSANSLFLPYLAVAGGNWQSDVGDHYNSQGWSQFSAETLQENEKTCVNMLIKSDKITNQPSQLGLSAQNAQSAIHSPVRQQGL